MLELRENKCRSQSSSYSYPSIQTTWLRFLLFTIDLFLQLVEMATRRIASVCLATSTRSAILRTARTNPTPRFQIPRQLHTTSIRYEQKANTSAKRDPAPKVVRGGSKVYKNADEAVADLKSGSIVLSAGFGLCGTAGEQLPSCGIQH